MSSSIQIIGMDALFTAIDANIEALRAGSVEAVTEVVDSTFDDSQTLVPYDSVTKHTSDYVHLKDRAAKDVQDEGDVIEGSVTYGTDHCEFVEHGTTRQRAQPYLNPAFEANKGKLIQKCQDLVK